MESIIKVLTCDQPGMLDRITGIIRRKGWNIRSVTVGEVSENLSQINLTIQGKNLDIIPVGNAIATLSGVSEWEVCHADSHTLREVLLFRVPKNSGVLEELSNTRVVGESTNTAFVEYTGAPGEVEQLYQAMSSRNIPCVRSGVLALKNTEEDVHG